MIHRWLPQKEAKAFVREHHRHHKPPRGAIVCIGAYDDGRLCGVAFIGRPPARRLPDRTVTEVTRVATDGTRNANSFLYGKAKRLGMAMGFISIKTYTLPEESGASLRAVKAKNEGIHGGGKWSREGRPRKDDHPTEKKLRWELVPELQQEEVKTG